jgi:hypothetical protein
MLVMFPLVETNAGEITWLNDRQWREEERSTVREQVRERAAD